MKITIILDRNSYYKEYFDILYQGIENNLKLNMLRFRILLRNSNIGECKYICDKNHSNNYYVFVYKK